MPWYIKTEHFTSETIKLDQEVRMKYINEHYSWVLKLKDLGITVSSGYLVDKNGAPGGGGLLMIEADSFQKAKSIIERDPIILAGLVTWKLQEWVPVSGRPLI